MFLVGQFTGGEEGAFQAVGASQVAAGTRAVEACLQAEAGWTWGVSSRASSSSRGSRQEH